MKSSARMGPYCSDAGFLRGGRCGLQQHWSHVGWFYPPQSVLGGRAVPSSITDLVAKIVTTGGRLLHKASGTPVGNTAFV